jgi:hypothetical protein
MQLKPLQAGLYGSPPARRARASAASKWAVGVTANFQYLILAQLNVTPSAMG